MYTIGSVAKWTGITERTIQYYDSLGLLTLTRIRGVRQLSERDLIGLLNILLLKAVNIKISDMKKMNAGDLAITDILSRLEEFELQLGEIMLSVEEWNKERSEDLLMNALKTTNQFVSLYAK